MNPPSPTLCLRASLLPFSFRFFSSLLILFPHFGGPGTPATVFWFPSQLFPVFGPLCLHKTLTRCFSFFIFFFLVAPQRECFRFLNPLTFSLTLLQFTPPLIFTPFFCSSRTLWVGSLQDRCLSLALVFLNVPVSFSVFALNSPFSG